jgi:HD-like signal output (HDOD) protein
LLSADPEISLGKLEKVLAGDQVLAGGLLQAANSGLVNRGYRASSIRTAMVRLGLDLTRRVIAAYSLRPLVSSSRLQPLWLHAIDTAQFVEKLARYTKIKPMEAFLAGLVHDVGRLVLERAPDASASVFRRLNERNTGLVFAELVVAGCDHAEIGGRVLELWNFPEEMIEGVRYHHAPERSRSKLASLLYLAEQRFVDEDEPSGVRVDQAMEWCGIAPDQLKSVLGGELDKLERLMGL